MSQKLVNNKTGEVLTYKCGVPIKRRFFVHEDIVEYYDKEIVKKIGEGEDEFVIEKKATEFNRMNRDDFIKSHASEVGVKNQIAKAIREGESPSVVLTEKFKSPQKGFVDEIKVEDALANPDELAKKVQSSLKRLPKDLRDKKSAREISEMSDIDIKKYVDDAVSQYFKAREKKVVEQPKGDVKNG